MHQSIARCVPVELWRCRWRSWYAAVTGQVSGAPLDVVSFSVTVTELPASPTATAVELLILTVAV
jgi:hypothetical protein